MSQTLLPVPSLPFPGMEALETRAVSRQLLKSRSILGELKGRTGIIPNEAILVSTLALREAKESSAVENIITTEDELFQTDSASGSFPTLAAKEVYRYGQALMVGRKRLQAQGFLRLDDILAIQAELVQNQAGIRTQSGTVLRNDQTGEVVYTPPQDRGEIMDLLSNFLAYFNRAEEDDPDPLVKMALLHHQFESIHPFYDGNGRTGRILNLLYLVLHELLVLPVLYMSRYIVRHKAEYYRGLQTVRTDGDWEGWLLFMLKAVEVTSAETIGTIESIWSLMMATKHRMRQETPNIYSQDLLNNLFRHPYTKVEYVQRDLGVVRQTAAKYLDRLNELGFVRKHKIKQTNYYINQPLLELLKA